MIIKGLKGLFQFLTILPIRMEAMISIEAVSKYFFICHIVALVIGFIAGTVGFISNFFLPDLISGFLVLASIQILTGFHHLDGLLDLSDAAMIRGDSKRKLEVIHDMYTGAAAVAVGFIVLAMTGLAFGRFSGIELLKATLVSEITAKESMILTAYLGKTPMYKGMGYYIVKSMKNRHLKSLFSIILSAAIVFFLVGASFVYIFATMAIAVVILSSYANKTLECVTGDVMGATNEINRMIALLVFIGTVS